ncbi:hypothetical protein [Akkermansia muciniphila]|uniref:hypothetical protein n=1 Tax=Akkermansia muciniphila TaxID=239935 RepID=UPI00211E0218|nr:hypothetical protein [Akkermansia muciniphila]
MTDSSIPDMMAEARRGQWTDQQLAAKAVELAESILKQSNAGMRGKEKRQAQQMERMMNDPAGKAFTLALADRVFRPSSPARGAELFRYLLDGYGVPRYLSAADRFAMKMGGEIFRSISGCGHARDYQPVEKGELQCHSSCRGWKTAPPPAPQAQGRHPNEHQPAGRGHSG